ncbi:MAG: hypothetical protein ACKOX6_08095 [Bdellovibrio sp.]
MKSTLNAFSFTVIWALGLLVAVSGPVAAAKAAPVAAIVKDKSVDYMARLLEQADGVHREAWWVLTSDRRPVGKSPFGKVQRALLSSDNVKLSNKSLFRCDRYLVKRDVMGKEGYPQRAEVFEKCSEKLAAKKIALLTAQKKGELQLVIYPEHLEEVLGLSATILNKPITCSLKGNGQGQLLSLNCKDWAQERTKEHMIRLDVYDYQKEGQSMIKLRGKVYENLTDIRKIEADIPMTGKIQVTETELYAPTPTPTVTPSPKASPAARKTAPHTAGQGPSPTGDVAPAPGAPPTQALPPGPLAAPGEEPAAEDADIVKQRIQAISPGALPAVESVNPGDAGWPTDDGQSVQENPTPLEPDEYQPHQQQQPLQPAPAAQPSRSGGGPVGR